MRRPETLRDRSGSITVHRASGLVFDSGHDFGLLQAFKRIGYPDSGRLPGRAMLNVDLLLRAGAVTRCHVLDATAEDPLHFRFSFYGADARLGDGKFRYRRVADHGIPLLQRYACREYSRLKSTGRPDLSQVDIRADWSVTAFRRLILPFGEGGKVTHFLILFTPDLQQVAPSTIYDVRPAVQQRVHD